MAGQQSGRLPPPRAFTPLLDVPVDNFTPVTSRSHSFLLTEAPPSTQQHHLSPNRRENGTPRHDHVSSLSVSDRGDALHERGRSPGRDGHGRGRREGSPDSVYGRQSGQEGYTEVSVRVPSQPRGRTPAPDVFHPQRERSPSSGQQVNRRDEAHDEVTTLIISKAKHSLGKHK